MYKTSILDLGLNYKFTASYQCYKLR